MGFALMAVMMPRVSITFNDDQETRVQGKVNSLALGFGIHQAWIYIAMFGLAGNMVTANSPVPAPSPEPSLVFFISVVTLACALLFAAVTDQKFLEFYTAKRVIIGASVFMAAGTAVIPLANPDTAIGMTICIFAGVSTGIGSALLLLFWGTNFSRHGNVTIILNTAIAIVLSFAIFSITLHVFPYAAACAVAALLPLCELPFLWNLTPVSYAVRHAIPIFNPLPVRKLPFAVKIALPSFLFGLIIGAIRSAAASTMLLSNDPTAQLLVLFVGGAVTTMLLMIPFCVNSRGHWDGLFRPVIVFIAATLLVLPLTPLGTFDSNSFVVVIGCMCFEALMWVFLGELSQEFRLSPVFMFGVGQSFLALGTVISPFATRIIFSAEPFNGIGETAIAMFIVILAYATMPHVSDIKRAVTQPEPDKNHAIISFNQRAMANCSRNAHANSTTGRTVTSRNSGPSSDAGTSFASTSIASAEHPCAQSGEKAREARETSDASLGASSGALSNTLTNISPGASPDASPSASLGTSSDVSSAISPGASSDTLAGISPSVSSGTLTNIPSSASSDASSPSSSSATRLPSKGEPATTEETNIAKQTRPASKAGSMAKHSDNVPNLEFCGQLPEIVISSMRDESRPSHLAVSASTAESEVARRNGRFRTQCEAIADTYLLSRRETEVMFLLARGYNAAYIQDKLYISKSTAKTHIGHIYRKLNIHNQQELLRMVEETYRG